MNVDNIDNLLVHLALQTRELSQKKNEINHQIKVYRADIAERRSYIETIHRKIKDLEEEINVKQSIVMLNKANAKSMKATNSQLLQYEQTLKEELESRKASYDHDKELFEARIASYWKIFQTHKEYYYGNPLAQKLLALQAEKVEIESRIKACDDQITKKQKELDHLTGPAVSSSSTEKLQDSVSGQQAVREPEKQLAPQTEDDSDSFIDISFLHLTQKKEGHETFEEANAEEIHEGSRVQDTTACSPVPEEASKELQPCLKLDEHQWEDQDVMQTEEQDQEMGLKDQALDQQSTVSGRKEGVEEEEEEKMMEEGVDVEEDQAQNKEDNEELAAFTQSSPQETNLQLSPAAMEAVPSTPAFLFNFSPGSSPQRGGASDTKSPAFVFSLNSEPSTPFFSGFGFEAGPSQDEESSFPFTESFFNEKKTSLFGQPEQSEDFQFAFTSKSPQTTNKDNNTDDFQFSFNF